MWVIFEKSIFQLKKLFRFLLWLNLKNYLSKLKDGNDFTIRSDPPQRPGPRLRPAYPFVFEGGVKSLRSIFP